MLKNGMMLIVAAFVACDASGQTDQGQLPDQFWLCNHPLPRSATIEVDYRHAMGLDWDYRTHIMTCGDASDCISFPVVLGVPPRVPGRGETVRWSITSHTFSMSRLADSSEDYEIRVSSGPSQRSGAASGDTLYYTYNLHDGVRTLRREGSADIWTRCRGRLTFEDLHRLRPYLVPEFRHNPNLSPLWRHDDNDTAPLDTNISVAVPR